MAQATILGTLSLNLKEMLKTVLIYVIKTSVKKRSPEPPHQAAPFPSSLPSLVDVNWLFVIIKSYVKVNFKERNNNNNNNNAGS